MNSTAHLGYYLFVKNHLEPCLMAANLDIKRAIYTEQAGGQRGVVKITYGNHTEQTIDITDMKYCDMIVKVFMNVRK